MGCSCPLADWLPRSENPDLKHHDSCSCPAWGFTPPAQTPANFRLALRSAAAHQFAVFRLISANRRVNHQLWIGNGRPVFANLPAHSPGVDSNRANHSSALAPSADGKIGWSANPTHLKEGIPPAKAR
jgi:hypothetical protein